MRKVVINQAPTIRRPSARSEFSQASVVLIRETQPFFGVATNRPISAGMAPKTHPYFGTRF
ncbi:MAG TPA: hypothetical protein VGZ26_00610, partial [Pirellulales bacterium]|nr:hypothetical protein [Pirellulales bacterium]